MKPRIVWLHGNQTEHWSFPWAGWLKDELETAGFDTFFETFPDSIIARAEYWLPFLKDHIQAGPNDVMVGWSSGTVAALRFITDNPVHSSILVSPYYTDQDDELEKQSGYFDSPWDWDAIKANQKMSAVFYSDDDPYIPMDQFEYVAERLDASKHLISHKGHFLEQETFPELLEYITKTYV